MPVMHAYSRTLPIHALRVDVPLRDTRWHLYRLFMGLTEAVCHGYPLCSLCRVADALLADKGAAPHQVCCQPSPATPHVRTRAYKYT